MDKQDKSEIIIAALVFAVYITFVLARNTCNTSPGSCTTSWVIFGVIFIGAAIFIMLKIFRA
ncbi:Uncharacterised protein [uncultured archaeon]|nr:Uncharacterised protein [uncultured archaeon]